MELVNAFREGGATMWGVFGVDLCAATLVTLALLLGAVARFTGKARGAAAILVWLGLFSALVPMCAGVGGYLVGMSRVEQAVEHADPGQKDVLHAVGQAEAANNLNFGFGSGCLCLLPAVLAWMLVPPKQIVYDDV